MADISHVHSVFLIELLLEGEDHDHLAHVLLDLSYAAGAPRPDLRADKIENRNSQAMKLPRQAQVEVGKINQDSGVRLATARLFHNPLELAANMGQARYHFH